MMSGNVGQYVDVFFHRQGDAAYAQNDEWHDQENHRQQQTQYRRRQVDHRKHLQECGGLVEKLQGCPFNEIVFFHEIGLGRDVVPMPEKCGGIWIGHDLGLDIGKDLGPDISIGLDHRLGIGQIRSIGCIMLGPILQGPFSVFRVGLE